MTSAGFTEKEAHIIMPIIGWMDVVLALITLVAPTKLTCAWMIVWAFSTAMIRPFSAGLKRACDPMNDNAIWGFVERAANWTVPLALLMVIQDEAYVPADIGIPVPPQLTDLLAPLNDADNAYIMKFMGIAFSMVWGVVPFLKMR